jgi:hypothetical protein
MNTAPVITDTPVTAPVVVSTTDKLAEVAALRAKAAELETAFQNERNAALTNLPAQFGYDSPKAFLKAFNAASKGTKPVTADGTPRKRASITPERRKEIKTWMKEHKDEKGLVLLTAQKFSISPATAQIIKDEAGLVEHR